MPVYFRTFNSTVQQFWVTDGTPTGTKLLSTIRPGGNFYGDDPQFTPLGGKLIFVANTDAHGAELWITDGTTAGTRLVKDIRPGDGHSLAFSDRAEITRVGDKLVFIANDGVSGDELWITDGTTAGTKLLKDITPGLGSSFSSIDPASFTPLGSKLVFAARDAVNGRELWITDGTTAGTRLLKNIEPNYDSDPEHFTQIGNKLVFSATNGSGRELWVTDGTTAGTQLLMDINPGWRSSINETLGPCFMRVGNKLVFSARDDRPGERLWVTDGTPGGTGELQDVMPVHLGSGSNTEAKMFAPFGNKLVFVGHQDFDNNKELWITDGTTAGTTLLKEIRPGSSGGFSNVRQQDFTQLGSNLVFHADDGVHGIELWVTNGTTGGTKLLKDINVGSGSSDFVANGPKEFARLGNNLVFVANDGVRGNELWITNGTTAGTKLIKDINPGSNGSFGGQDPGELTKFTALGNKLVFTADDGVNGSELWVTDGTTGGTMLLKNITAGGGGSSPDYITYWDYNTGTTGADVLGGRAGADTMTGLAGNDIYVINHVGDRVVEAVNGGTDRVQSSVISLNLANYANVEYALLYGTANLNLTGNSGNNVLTGNAGNNVIDGGAGTDTMSGGLGNDVYVVSGTADRVVETSGAGTDRVQSSVISLNLANYANVENATLTGWSHFNLAGNAGNNVLTGNNGNNYIGGSSGNDTIYGGFGNDTLAGGADKDVFVFNTWLNASTNVDRINDFSVADDAIRLENAIFTKLTITGALNTAYFKIGAPTDVNDYIIYNRTTGTLSYDADGSGGGAAVRFATLSTNLLLTAGDFYVI